MKGFQPVGSFGFLLVGLSIFNCEITLGETSSIGNEGKLGFRDVISTLSNQDREIGSYLQTHPHCFEMSDDGEIKVDCNFEALTKSCEMFSPDKDRIAFSDGSFIPNFSYLTDVDENTSLEENIAKHAIQDNDNRMSGLEGLERAVQVFDEAEGLSDRARLYMATNLSRAFGRIVFGKELKKSPEFLVSTVWPLDDPAATVQQVKLGDVQSALRSKLNESQWNSIAEIVDSNHESLPDRIIASQGSGTDLEKDMRNVSPERKKKVAELVEFARQKLIAKIKGAPNRIPNKAEQDLIRKVEQIVVTDFDSDRLATNMTCTGSIPNAFYMPSDNSINICPNFMNAPDESLLGVIAHEIAHSVDPCNSQFGLQEMNKEKIKGLIDPATGVGKADQGLSEPEKMAVSALEDFSMDGAGKTAFPLDLVFGAKTKSKLIDLGVLSEFADPVKPESNPFKGVLACLVSEAGGGFRDVAKDEIDKLVSEVTETRSEQRGAGYDAAADAEKIRTAFGMYPGCVGVEDHSQLGEVFSDWVAADVVGDYLEGQSLVTDEDRLKPMGFFASIACKIRHDASYDSSDRHSTPGAVITSALSDFYRASDPHPSPIKRLNDILLRNDKVRKAIGCTDQKTGNACERTSS